MSAETQTTPTGPQAQEAGMLSDDALYAIADQQVKDWQKDGRMEPYAWDFRGFAIDAMRRFAATSPTPARVVSDSDVARAWDAYNAATDKLDASEEGSLMDRMHAGMKAALSTLQSGAEGKDG